MTKQYFLGNRYWRKQGIVTEDQVDPESYSYARVSPCHAIIAQKSIMGRFFKRTEGN